ncbi:hypothetical protein Dform_00132 [Dehalogenimonas formicexedens]|uniref:Uncharacterized protein n=1 Tax=Dehalogenimonas formicexedens TaxID=1839801 RepID=A0A1P8F4X1_9CHLR|nr:hypothetical protein Dform_00132 [Dehalogenimonas formicexedens]
MNSLNDRLYSNLYFDNTYFYASWVGKTLKKAAFITSIL